MRRLVDNPVRRYAWGSVEAIPRLLHVEPDGSPQAELWLGAHERGASRLLGPDGSTCLLDAVRSDPESHLGPGWSPAGRMPFLAKVIAIARPLSLQVHPDAVLAARWYAEEEARGIGRAERHRSCPDDVAKVEMVWALSEFRALCGFRPVEESVRWLEALDVAVLKPTAEALREGGTEALRTEVPRLLGPEAPTEAVSAIRARAEVLEHDPRWERSARVAVDLATRYPDDPAVALALLLRPLTLAPGEAMFVRAGQPHTYLAGTAFEVQANSDNVLRAGLTDKHVDPGLLVQALDTSGRGVAGIAGARVGDEEVFAPETDRFALAVLRRSGGAVPLPQLSGPQLFLCVDGDFTLTDAAERLRLVGGQAAYVPAVSAPLQVRGSGTLLRVTTGRAAPPAGAANARTAPRDRDRPRREPTP